MEVSSSQSEGSSTNIAPGNLENINSLSYKTILNENMYNNRILLKLEEDGFITPDEKVKELIKELSEIKYLYALKVLFENLQNEFSSQSLINSLEALIDPTSNYYSKESMARLELHLRTWVTVLERVCFLPIVLTKFAEIHRKTTQFIEIKLDNNFRQNFNQFNQQNTLHSLRDDETWFQEIIRRTKDFLKAALNITPGILSAARVALPNDNCSNLSLLTQVRQGLSFKYFLEREWVNAAEKSILDSQIKFDEASNKVVKALKNAGGFLNELAGNEPIALPHTLWFGILDLAQNLIRRSSRIAIYGLCYYLAIESLNKAPSSFIQFNENNLEDSLEKFRNLLTFVKEKYNEDLKILSNNTEKGKEEKGKSLNQNSYLKEKQTSNSNILDVIADEITCPINSEPTDQLYNDIRYLPQNSIYKNLYTKFFESGHILPSIELENSEQLYDSDDSDNSEVELILTEKKKFMNSIIKLNSNISSSILSKLQKNHIQHIKIL
ncbi:hypothetical protein C1646_765923 [Rhizophagus diaphanus]|nr:hypothetical protein C1646_765923 [Rhizophagus diaphanus] [Rhizophagus sp. MUCL 43196]